MPDRLALNKREYAIITFDDGPTPIYVAVSFPDDIPFRRADNTLIQSTSKELVRFEMAHWSDYGYGTIEFVEVERG